MSSNNFLKLDNQTVYNTDYIKSISCQDTTPTSSSEWRAHCTVTMANTEIGKIAFDTRHTCFRDGKDSECYNNLKEFVNKTGESEKNRYGSMYHPNL